VTGGSLDGLAGGGFISFSSPVKRDLMCGSGKSFGIFPLMLASLLSSSESDFKLMSWSNFLILSLILVDHRAIGDLVDSVDGCSS